MQAFVYMSVFLISMLTIAPFIGLVTVPGPLRALYTLLSSDVLTRRNFASGRTGASQTMFKSSPSRFWGVQRDALGLPAQPGAVDRAVSKTTQ